MAMIGKVRRLHYRQQKSVREIARLTSLSRNTVRKWLKAPVVVEPKYRRGVRPGKLTPAANSSCPCYKRQEGTRCRIPSPNSARTFIRKGPEPWGNFG